VLEAVTARGDVRVGAVRTPLGPLVVAHVALGEDGGIPVVRVRC